MPLSKDNRSDFSHFNTSDAIQSFIAEEFVDLKINKIVISSHSGGIKGLARLLTYYPLVPSIIDKVSAVILLDTLYNDVNAVIRFVTLRVPTRSSGVWTSHEEMDQKYTDLMNNITASCIKQCGPQLPGCISKCERDTSTRFINLPYNETNHYTLVNEYLAKFAFAGFL